MSAFPVRIGIDEIATETQMCDGFTYFCLPERFAPEFARETQTKLRAASLSAFHGKEFRSKDSGAFRDFLVLAYDHLKKSPQSFAACRLFSPKVKAQLKSFCDRSVKLTIEKSVGIGHRSIEILQPYFLPLACLAALARELGPEMVMRVEMDSHRTLRDLNESVHQASGVDIDAATLLKAAYNGYAKYLHTRAPLLPDDGVIVLDDQHSVIVQAADVLGNFAMAHIFVLLGKATPGRKAKSDIVRAVFGREADVFDPTGKLTFVGNDLVLLQEGGITFSVAWKITTLPDDAELMKDWPVEDGFLGRRID